jgi:hypothetical protein
MACAMAQFRHRAAESGGVWLSAAFHDCWPEDHAANDAHAGLACQVARKRPGVKEAHGRWATAGRLPI